MPTPESLQPPPPRRGPAPDVELSRLVALVARSTRAPMALVTLLDDDRQYFLAQLGLPEDLRLAASTPRSWSFCRRVVETHEAMCVQDATEDASLCSSPLVKLHGIRSYAGVPIRLGGGVVGTLCVLSGEPRVFGDDAMAALELGAELVEARLAPRTEVNPGAYLTDHGALLPPLGEASPESTATIPSLRAPVRFSSPPEAWVGHSLDGRYLLTALLGVGGMSRVYLAREQTLGQLVAIKVLEQYFDDEALLREAKALAELRHPSIVRLYGWGRMPSPGDHPYLVLEYVRGELLPYILQTRNAQQNPFSTAEALRILRNLSGALDTLHAAGMVHGDVKPGNIILDASFDRAVLIDFGLVGRTHELGGVASRSGTPGHSAPEQFGSLDAPPSPTQDVYALGTICYALLAGRGPFADLRPMQRLDAQRSAQFRPLSTVREGLPPGIDREIARALDPSAHRRHGSASEFVDAIEAVLTGVNSRPTFSDPGHPTSSARALSRTRQSVRLLWGEDADLRGLAAFDEATFALISSATGHETLPAVVFHRYLELASEGNLERLQMLGEHQGAAHLPEMLASLQTDRSPNTLLRAIPSLIHRAHGWGEFSFEPISARKTAVSVVLPRGFAPVACATLGGILRAAVKLSAPRVALSHARCQSRGDDHCEMHFEWSS